ncbi:MAG: DMT family transporter [Pseudomonadota bacterium]|nr:DMT family transporter [Pseudomonadota bacterium]
MKTTASPLRAILFACAGFTLWVLVDTAIKLAAEASLPPHEVTAVLGFVGVAAMGMKAWRQGTVRNLKPKNIRYQLIGALLSLAINLVNVIALRHLPFIVFYITVFTAPMMIAVLAAIFLNEHPSRGKILAIIVGFAGVVVAINPFGANLHGDWIGYVTATASVFCFAAQMTLLRKMTQSETGDSLVFIPVLMQTLVCGVWLLIDSEPMSLRIFLILCAGGVFGILGNLCSMLASKYAAAATVAQFHYTQVLAGALIGFLIWHEVPGLWMVVGSTVIIGSGLYIAAHTRRGENLAALKRVGQPS